MDQQEDTMATRTASTQPTNSSFFRFEDLRVYTKATDYAAWLAAQMASPRTDSEKNIATTFLRSAFDISLNIAEGSSRSKSQFDHYLKISKTAIRECVVYGEVCRTIGFFDNEQYEQSREYLMELTRMLGALIISLQRSSERRHDRDDDAGDYAAGDDMSY